jgi:hypothetical protein
LEVGSRKLFASLASNHNLPDLHWCPAIFYVLIMISICCILHAIQELLYSADILHHEVLH